MTSRTFDLLMSAWTFCDVDDREVFIEYLRVCGALEFQAKASEDNGSITGGAGAVAGEVSRVGAGRTAPATSDDGRDSLERQAPNSPSGGGPAGTDLLPGAGHPFQAFAAHCLRPDACAGVGAKHCHSCTKAIAESEVAA